MKLMVLFISCVEMYIGVGDINIGTEEIVDWRDGKCYKRWKHGWEEKLESDKHKWKSDKNKFKSDNQELKRDKH